jgi:hypothetical protein
MKIRDLNDLELNLKKKNIPISMFNENKKSQRNYNNNVKYILSKK